MEVEVTTPIETDNLTTSDYVIGAAIGILAGLGVAFVGEKVGRFVVNRVKAHKAKKTIVVEKTETN